MALNSLPPGLLALLLAQQTAPSMGSGTQVQPAPGPSWGSSGAPSPFMGGGPQGRFSAIGGGMGMGGGPSGGLNQLQAPPSPFASALNPQSLMALRQALAPKSPGDLSSAAGGASAMPNSVNDFGASSVDQLGSQLGPAGGGGLLSWLKGLFASGAAAGAAS